MARSLTTYTAKWNLGDTKVVRVPVKIADQILDYARALDSAILADSQVVKEPLGALYHTLKTDKPVNIAQVPLRSPFRYPGGKTWLVPYIRRWLQSARRRPRYFLEPFAGGAITSLTVAFESLAERAFIAETEPGVRAVWYTILSGQGEWLANKILSFDLTEKNVRSVLDADSADAAQSIRERAFATIVRNRVQRGGILAPGAGLVKVGENGRGLNSRWYPLTLATRIREIEEVRSRLSFFPDDGFQLIQDFQNEPDAAIFLDPPYTVAAKRLYSHWNIDHAKLFGIAAKLKGDFLLTYDDTDEVKDLASQHGFSVKRIAMKNTHHVKKHELLIGRNLDWVPE